MVKVLLVFSQNHAEFRLPELECVCDLFSIKLGDNKNELKKVF